MKFLLLSLLIALRRRILCRRTAILMLSLSMMLAGCAWLLQTEDKTVSPQMGIRFESDDLLAEGVMERLAGDDVFTYRRLDGAREEIELLVSTGELECAFLIPRGLRATALSGDYKGAVEMIVSPQSLFHSLARMRLFVAITECISEDIAVQELVGRTGRPATELEEIVAERFGYYRDNYVFVKTDVAWRGAEDSRDSLPPPFSPARVLHGMLSLFLLLAVATAVPSLLEERHSLLQALPPSQAAQFWICSVCSVFLLSFGAGGCGLLILWSLSPVSLGPIGLELLWLTLYAGGCTLLGALAALLLRTTDMLFAVTVFVLLACLLLGGVLVSPTELGGVFPGLARIIPSTSYLEGVLNATLPGTRDVALLLLLLLAVCCLPFLKRIQLRHNNKAGRAAP